MKDNDGLACEFSNKEIKRARWDFDSSKSLGLDSVTLAFIKEFQEVIKCDFIRFIA